MGGANFVDNPVVASLSRNNVDALAQDYNMNFEPYASKYDNKMIVDQEAGDVIGVQRRRASDNSEQAAQN